MKGAPARHSGAYLLVGVASFPLHFVPVRAEPTLLAEAGIDGVCRHPAADAAATAEIRFTLSADRPAVTLALPPEAASAATLELEARSVHSDARLSLGIQAARGVKLDLASLREYGPHTVAVEAEFDRDVPLLAVELLAEHDQDHPDRADTVALTPARARGEWSYFAASPFVAGYRHRPRAAAGAAGEWSAVQSPFEPLRVRASASMTPTDDLHFDFGGLTSFPAGDEPWHHYYLPHAPAPETGPDGHPTLMVMPMGDAGLLQLGVRFAAPDAALEAHRAELARLHQLANPALVRLSPAPVTVNAVRLMIAEAAGQWSEAARNPSSGLPPYSAVFQVRLTPQQRAAVAAALNGRTGQVRLDYDLTLTLPATARVRVSGDLRPLLSELPPPGAAVDPLPQALALIEQALADRRLRLERETAGPAPAALTRRAIEVATAQLAALLVAARGGQFALPDAAPVSLAVQLAEPQATAQTRSTDVASWFAPGAGPEHIRLLPGRT